MSVIVSLHAAEYGKLLKALKENRRVFICDMEWEFRIPHFLGITGKEQRLLTDEEIERLTEHYKDFNQFYRAKGWLPVAKLG